MTPLQAGGLFVIGAVTGIFGSIVGLGGGFLAVPLVRLLYGVSPATASAAGLVMVFSNALSASFAYARDRRIDMRLAFTVGAVAIPTAIVGTLAVHGVSGDLFDILYGVFLIATAVETLRRLRRTPDVPPADAAPGSVRVHRDADGNEYRYRNNLWVSLATGAAVGFMSSFFGVGGGVVFVPVMILLMGIPAHIVAATSTFVIVLTAPVGIVTHFLVGDVEWPLAIPLALGALVGGQIGARVAKHLSAVQLNLTLATMLILAVGALGLRHLR